MSGARIFDLQRFSIHDGPGIRTTLFLKGCPLRCAWCQNPEGLEGAIRLWSFAHLCQSCGTCVKSCPRGALAPREGPGVLIDRRLCDLCGKCLEACPRNALALDGRDIESADALEQLAADRVFHEVSGGGVTFSGGEPLQQTAFVLEVASLLKARGVHTAVETSLFAPWESIESLLGVVDLFICDVKIADPELHREATQQDNALIVENLRALARALRGSGRLLVRVPLIPRMTATRENLSAIALLLEGIDPSIPIELMNFNPLAAAKYRRMGQEYAFEKDVSAFTEAQMEGFRAILSERGLSVR